MRWRWVLTWLLCAALTVGLIIVWNVRPKDIGDAASVVAAVIGLFSVLTVWAWRRSPRHGRSTSGQVAEAAQVLARQVRRQWQDEAVLRQLFDPAPLPVLWSDCPLPDVSDHRQLIGAPVTCRSDAPQELAAAFRSLPRRRLVVLGPAGSGKTTLAVLLTLALLGQRDPDDPVPVLLSLASFDPSRDSVQAWLRRQIAADYSVLADIDTYGPSAIEDLLAEGRVLPVLEALDERPEAGRATVLTALNDTLDPHTPVVLTCRTANYATAVTEAGVLTGAAVIAPSPVRPDDALTLLRLATPPGPRQTRWDALAEHMSQNPDGPAAQALASPLMVALARAVYADAPGDPTELADTGRFPSPATVEHHLLDSLVPTLYARAHQQDPSGRPWSPQQAHRYLIHLAVGMRRQDTYDLSWWQLHRWVPALAHTWSRPAAWTALLIALTLLGYEAHGAIPGFPPRERGVMVWYLQGMAAALPCMCWFAAWAAVRPRLGTHRFSGAVLTALCGGAAFAVPGMTFNPVNVAPGWYVVGCEAVTGFAFLLVLYTAGLPVPPSMPSRGSITLWRWHHRLPRAVAMFCGTTVLTAAALYVYALVVRPMPGASKVHSSQGAELPWAYGLTLGAVVGVVQILFYWLRGPTTAHDLTAPASAVRADRLVTLVCGGAGVLLVALPYGILAALGNVTPQGQVADDVVRELAVMLLGVGPTGLVLALATCSWPHYTAARLSLAARGRLPWRLQAFLADAHRLGILRQVGPVYQFRHARLQQRLAAQTRIPGPRPATARSGSPSSEPTSS